jgi:hypothetical protein
MRWGVTRIHHDDFQRVADELSIRAGDIEDIQFTTDPLRAFVEFRVASTLYIVPFVRDQDRWIIADFARPILDHY